MKQIPLPIAAAAEARFDDFVPGANAAALAHLRALAGASAPVPSLYLWGPAGSGKTHLLRALAAARATRGAVAWFDAATPLPWTVDGAVALVVIDDAHALDAARQHAAFALFVEAAVAGWPLAAAGRMPPVDLPLRDDLRTRLGGGFVFALQPLSDAEVRAALRARADARGIALGDDVIDYLLSRFARDMKHLTHLLDRLDDQAWVDKRARVTLPLLKRALADGGAEVGAR